MRQPTRCDVAVVGAGISGLSCAAALSARGLKTVVIESGEQVGGRIRTYRPPDGGPPVELGAQVIHGDKNPLRDLAGGAVAVRRALPTRPVPRDGEARVLAGGRIMPIGALTRGGLPPWLAEQRLAESVTGAPGLPGSGGGSVGQWLASQRLARPHQAAAAEWFRQNWAADPGDLSADAVAAAWCGGHRTGAGEYAFADGFGALAEALAEAAGPVIRLGMPVRAVDWAPGRAELAAAGGELVTSRAVVITVPPPLVAAGRPAITPLPAHKAAAARALRSGDGLCAVVTMARPAPETAVVFDADGRCGFVRCAAGRREVLIVAKAAAAGAVRAAGRSGLAALAAVAARALPWSADVAVSGATVADWGSGPWSAGAFSYPAAGVRRAAQAWAAPAGRTLFFAGEAVTAGLMPASVHGALGSGLAAADQVAEALA